MKQPVFDILNCGENHRFWANGKLIHNSDKVNLQNLAKRTKDPVLRRSMKALPNHLWVASDSSQVEARLNAYMSNQTDLVQLFIDRRDPYVDMATAIYNKPYDEIFHLSKVEPTKEGKTMRNLGKEATLACGYGMSAPTFKYRMELTGNIEAANMADTIVSAYRSKNNMIVNFWNVANTALDVMYNQGEISFGGPNDDLFVASGITKFHGVMIPSIKLPNDTYIFYQNLRKEPDDTGRYGYVYDQFKGNRFVPKRIWGSALVENCIAEDTKVLTDRGWVNIQDVRITDKVHDGVEFVTHGGVVFKSIQSCVKLDGVYMTNDHEVLTDDGWQKAELYLSKRSTSQLSRFDFSEVWQANSDKSNTQRREKMVLGFPMRLWKHSKPYGMSGKRSSEKRFYPTLWVQYIRDSLKKSKFSWEIKSPYILDMEKYESPLLEPKQQSVAQLWWSRDNSMQRVVRFSNFLFRYVTNLSNGFRPRPYRQRWKLYSAELPMGYENYKLQQSEKFYTHTRRRNRVDYSTVLRKVWYWKNYNIIPFIKRHDYATISGSTRFGKKVYDIINCGSRNRFVVSGTTGPFVVHNCCQALAFAVLKWQAINIVKDGYDISMNVHDEWAGVYPKHQVRGAIESYAKNMRMVPEYLPQGLLDCEVDIGLNYAQLQTVKI